MKRRLLQVFLVLLLGVVAGAGWLLWDNNRDRPLPDEQAYRQSLERSVQWLLARREALLRDTNSMLWWMVSESAQLSQDPRLLALFAEYKRARLDPDPRNIWGGLFDPNHFVRVTMGDLAHFPDYNQHFIYGLTCSRALEQEPAIQRQLEAGFCDQYHPVSPACVTHQMMGLRFMQRNHCGNEAEVQQVIAQLQDKIVTQLTWDPRVVDVYLQRVLMLVDSGARARIKPVWLHQVLEAQMEDGGWGGMQPLLPVGSGNYVGFNARIVGIGKPRSSFHATAQGLLLMNYLLHDRQ